MNSMLAVCLAVLAPAASAQILVPTSQNRFVEAKASIDLGAFTVDLRSAPSFAPFAEVAMAARSGPNPFPTSSAEASQLSVIGTDSIEASGSAEANTVGGLADAFGRSSSVVAFTINQPASYRVFGSLDSNEMGAAFFHLVGTGSNFRLSQTANAGLSMPFDFSGVLPAGTYRFEANAQVFGQDGNAFAGGDATYDARLELAPITASDCAATPNSTGNTALIQTRDRAWPNQFSMTVTGGVPGEFGLMVYGQPLAPTPLGDGSLCVGQPLIRFPSVIAFDTFSGSAFDAVSISSSPFDSGPGAIAYGSQWTFQFWYRDTAAQLSGFNLSNTLTVTFIP